MGVMEEATPSFKPKVGNQVSPEKGPGMPGPECQQRLASKQHIEETTESLEHLEEEPVMHRPAAEKLGYHLNLNFIVDDEHRAIAKRGRSFRPRDSSREDSENTDRFYRRKHTSSPMRQYSAINALTNRADAHNKSTI